LPNFAYQATTTLADQDTDDDAEDGNHRKCDANDDDGGRILDAAPR